MNVNIDVQKININLAAKETQASKSQTSAKVAKASSSAPSVVPRALAATGLPADKLSASVLSFARFFSLPLKPQLLADIRRQALMPQLQPNMQAASAQSASAANIPVPGETTAMQKSFTDIKTREAFSLAAAAAESKGAELQQKALESYAEAVDPDLHKRRQSDEQRKRRDKDQNEQANVITAEGLKKLVLNSMEKDPLLDILNKLPGKNGQRWIVIPFDFCDGNREYFVTMRILTEEVHTPRTDRFATRRILSQSCCFLTLDVLVRKGEEENRRLFIFESANEKPIRVTVCVWQELSAKDQRQLKTEISKTFNIPFKNVSFRTSEESFPFEQGHGEPLASIDEAV